MPIINYEDLKKVIAVRAKLNNPRIERQHGSFLIFGIGSKKTEQAELQIHGGYQKRMMKID